MPRPFTSVIGTGVNFAGMSPLGIKRGLDLAFNLIDKSSDLYLCVGDEDNRVLITGTTPISRQADVLNAIDQYGRWGQAISLWMVTEKQGTLTARTLPVDYKAHVKPYYGRLSISGFAADHPRLTYPGNGIGRLLSPLINDRYYFTYGGKLETDDDMRGFDCTSFPMALLSIPRIAPPGYGKQLCDAAGATKCALEQMKSADLKKRFQEKTIPSGIYILFSSAHVLLYNADLNWLYEFSYGGFFSTSAAQKELRAPQDLWWMRKLDDKYRPAFS